MKTLLVTSLEWGLGEPPFHLRRVICAVGGVPPPASDTLKAVSAVACGPAGRETSLRLGAGGSNGSWRGFAPSDGPSAVAHLLRTEGRMLNNY